MTTTTKFLGSKKERVEVRFAYFLSGVLMCLPGYVTATDLSLSDVPLFITSRADPSVLLNMSVETPMGGAAYADQPGNPTGCGTGTYSTPRPSYPNATGNPVGICYIPTTTYLGYFDPNKCYDYTSNRFEPTEAADALHQCDAKWSGNFLNWASMTAIDEFIWTMTGGNRIVDTTSETVIRRARKQNNNSWFPYKLLKSTYNVAPSAVTPFSDSDIFIYNTDWGINVGTVRSSVNTAPDKGSFNIDVKACVAVTAPTSVGRESNCVAYTSGASTYYKPEGLLQKNAAKMRFALTSYTFDTSQSRDGGVLRSNMKYLGPTRPAAGGGTEDNPNKEFGVDGLFINNPDGASGLNSGVINYVNQFSAPGYKTYDPIGELYYESLRYFKNLGPTPEYSSGLTTAQKGGFDIITSWDDPYQHPCQKCFIIGINDANPWLDKKLPGTFFTSPTIAGPGSTTYSLIPVSPGTPDYGQPSNPDSSIDVRALTNAVGSMEGLNGTPWTSTGTWTSAGAGGSVSGTNDSVGGGPGTFDNSCSNKTVGNLGEVMGTCPGPGKQNSYYIAGLAYYANTEDLRSDLSDEQTVSSFFIDTQEYNANPLDGPKNMLWLAGKYGGFVDSNDNDQPDQASEWDSDGDGVPDNYVRSTEPDKLVNGLNAAFEDIEQRTSSASAVAVNTTSLQANSKVFQATFDSDDWSGQLLAYPIDPATGKVGATEDWEAGALLDGADFNSGRKIVTYKPSKPSAPKGIPFRWPATYPSSPGPDELDLAQSQELDKSPVTATPDGNGAARLNYLRGDTSVAAFRARTHVLGDIVSSSPIYVGAPDFYYPDNFESASYLQFKSNNASRTPMVYVGANDGMLHAFEASTGEERAAYVPAVVFKNLNKLTDPGYGHRYYVDGTPTVGDAFFGGTWHTVLVGGLRGGGQGIYALDVTSPPAASDTESSIATKVLWEFTDQDDLTTTPEQEGHADLGYTYGEPNIVRMHNGRWAAVFGNGYNNMESDGSASTSGNAVLYIVDLETGVLIGDAIDTGVGAADDPTGASRANGLATPAPVDANGDSIVDYIYAGDLFGNMWKFDVTNSDPANWNVAYGGSPLFTACEGTGACPTLPSSSYQPITTRPEVGRHPTSPDGFMVYFGTGKYLEGGAGGDNDPSDPSIQSFYGIWDKNQTTLTDFDRGELVNREILDEPGFDSNGDGTNDIELRVTEKDADDPIDWATDMGWYMDLVDPDDNLSHGEKQVTDSILRNGRIIFTTLIPSLDPCDAGGTGWLMEFDAVTGGQLSYAPFDLTGEGEFTQADYVDLDGDGTLDVPPSGKKSTVGIPTQPGIVGGGGGGGGGCASGECKYINGSEGKIEMTVENTGPDYTGRTSWRELKQ